MLLGRYTPYKGYVYSPQDEDEEDVRKIFHLFYKEEEMQKARDESRFPTVEFELDYTPYQYLSMEQFKKAVDSYEDKQSK
tara:strand:- start:2745 stop:2984 length:240 start_codon:yes stop_codon:yes gene_type:complete